MVRFREYGKTRKYGWNANDGLTATEQRTYFSEPTSSFSNKRSKNNQHKNLVGFRKLFR